MALVQTQSANFNLGTSQTLTLGSPATTGNTIITSWAAGYTGLGTPSFSVNDTASNTYNQILSTSYSTGVGPFVPAGEVFLFAAYNITGGFTNITYANSGITGGMTGIMIAREYSALATSPLDGTPSINNQTQTTTSTSGNTTTSKMDDLLVGFQMITNATAPSTAGSGFGNLVSEASAVVGTQWLMMEDENVTSTGTYAATFGLTGTINAYTGIAAFSNASQPGNTNHFLSMMGCGL